MVTVHELAEAQAFERRRVLRAFVTGNPVPPRGDGPSPWRCLAGGLALATVLVLGVAAAALLGVS